MRAKYADMHDNYANLQRKVLRPYVWLPTCYMLLICVDLWDEYVHIILIYVDRQLIYVGIQLIYVKYFNESAPLLLQANKEIYFIYIYIYTLCKKGIHTQMDCLKLRDV